METMRFLMLSGSETRGSKRWRRCQPVRTSGAIRWLARALFHRRRAVENLEMGAAGGYSQSRNLNLEPMNAEKSQKLRSSGAIRPLQPYNLTAYILIHNGQELLEELKEYYVRRKEQDFSQGQLADNNMVCQIKFQSLSPSSITILVRWFKLQLF
ncbi:hypothetical protein M5K25_026765 [Dendrobium thyrsiflorum]|uniref:Uncharacterized protein n=1 Tax=Dendrobium thyrsiflorum TaxID=117978 RepID=A0ABD0TY82_DENTH